MTPPNKQPSITDADREAEIQAIIKFWASGLDADDVGDFQRDLEILCDKAILHERAKVDELVRLLKDSLRTRRFPAPEDAEVMALGKRIGFGALMDSAQKCWRETVEEKGLAGSEFTVGHCVGVVEKALKQFSGRSG